MVYAARNSRPIQKMGGGGATKTLDISIILFIVNANQE
jgi:hypothetical protein